MTAEINKALVFKDGKVQRVKDDVALEVGNGLKMQEAGQAPSAEEAFGKMYSLADTAVNTTSTTKLFFLDDTGTSHYLQPDGLETLTEPATGSFYVDFNPELPSMRTVTLTKATDFASTAGSLKPGRSVSLHIKNASDQDLEVTFPSTVDDEGATVSLWTWLGGTTPTSIPAGVDAILSIVSIGTTEEEVLAAFSYDDSEQVTGIGTPDYLAVFENPRDIRSALLYLYEEDQDGDGTIEVTRLGIGQGFGPEFEADGTTATGLFPPEVSLQVKSNQLQTEAVLKLESADDAFKMFALNNAPEGAITGDIGDIAVDGTNGSLYFKASGENTTTGWVRFATDTQTYTAVAPLAANEVCYFSADDTVKQAKADAAANSKYPEARFAGFVVAVVSDQAQVQTEGVFRNAAFATGLTLQAGQPVYLSKTAGKLTNDVSTLAEGEVVAEVGIIVNAASNLEADVLIQPKPIVVL